MRNAFKILIYNWFVVFALCCGAMIRGIEAADPPTLTHGPIVGRPTERTMRIWGRTSAPAPFEVRYGTDANRFDRRSKTVATQIDHDNAGWVELSELEPETRYHYQIYIGELPQGSAGSFRTLP